MAELLKKLSNRPVLLNTVFAEAFGGITNAILFQQLYFWGDKGKRPDGYIYKTKAEIQNETTLTARQQDRSRKELEKLGILKTQLIKVRGFPTLHYKVGLNASVRVISQYYNMSVSSITEMTPEKRKKDGISPYRESHAFEARNANAKKDERAVRIVQYFKTLCLNHIGVEPLIGAADEKLVRSALKIASEPQICEWLKRRISARNKPDKELIQLRQALSAHAINTYRTE